MQFLSFCKNPCQRLDEDDDEIEDDDDDSGEDIEDETDDYESPGTPDVESVEGEVTMCRDINDLKLLITVINIISKNTTLFIRKQYEN